MIWKSCSLCWYSTCGRECQGLRLLIFDALLCEFLVLGRPHVWGHFCLCYGDQKLLMETDYIKNYGIRDGDQVRDVFLLWFRRYFGYFLCCCIYFF